MDDCLLVSEMICVVVLTASRLRIPEYRYHRIIPVSFLSPASVLERMLTSHRSLCFLPRRGESGLSKLMSTTGTVISRSESLRSSTCRAMSVTKRCYCCHGPSVGLLVLQNTRIQLPVDTDNHCTVQTVNELYYLREALWRVFKTQPCNHQLKDSKEVELSLSMVTMVGFDWAGGRPAMMTTSERICICLAKGDARARWLVLAAFSINKVFFGARY